MNELLQKVLSDPAARDGNVLPQVAATAAEDFYPWYGL